MTVATPVGGRAVHRAGPVEREPLEGGGHVDVVRCLRCDGMLAYRLPEEGIWHRAGHGIGPLPVGARVRVGRCPDRLLARSLV